MNINVNSCREINCEWYKKPKDTGVGLNFSNSAPIQHMKNVVEGTVHRVFRSSSRWQKFDKALKENESIWLKNQYPESWSSKIINDALQKIISKPQLKNGGEKIELRGQKPPANHVKPLFFLHYRVNVGLQLKRKLERTCKTTAILTTRKLPTCLPP